MNLSRKLIAQLKHAKSPFLCTVLSASLLSLTVVFQAYVLARIIDAAFLDRAALSDLGLHLTGFVLLSGLRFLWEWLENRSASTIACIIKQQLRHQLTDHLTCLAPAEHKHDQTGELVNTTSQGIDALEPYFSEYLPQLMLALLIPVLILCVVFPLDWISGVIFLVTAPLIPLFMVLIGDSAQRATHKQWTVLSRMSAFFLDVIQGIVTLKTLGRSRDYGQRIAAISHEFRRTTLKGLRIAFLSALTLEMLATISTAIVAVGIGLRLLHGHIDFLNGLFILILAPEFYQPLRQLGARFHAGMEGFAASQRIFALLDRPQRQEPPAIVSPVTFSESDIRFDNVGFQYPDAPAPVLSQVSFALSPGQKVVLVGPSGSGKTTLCKLFLKLLDGQQGHIRIGDHDLNDIPMSQWQQQIAWVSQHPTLFHASVRDNLRLAQPDASDQDLQDATQKAHLHDFLAGLPAGYDTVIGEQGARFSGGQAQRLALARAFLKDAPLLVLDEPTSNLDPHCEQQILNAIDALARDKTVLIIAHRLNTLKHADLILSFSRDGRVEPVTFNQILAEQTR